MQHVIIGAGPAGVTACETLRQLDPEATILLLGDEPEPPYSRMAIPYFLTNKVPIAGTYLRKDENHYQRQRIEVHRVGVHAVDSRCKSLCLSDGSEIGYDRLLLATGASPVKPPVPGIDSPGVLPCWTLADARQIVSRCTPGSRVVLMGAGFIGCIVLEALVERGARLTLVEPQNRMVPRMMNETAGGMLTQWCMSKGVRVLVSTAVTAIESGEPLSVLLAGGERLSADLVIRATGVRPNVGFLAGSGIAVDQGVRVGDYLETSAEGVYAAGDVCQGKDLSTAGFQVQAIQPTAVEHGRLAAHNMVSGGRISHRGNLNMNVLDTLGLVSTSFGHWEGVEGGDSVELLDRARFRYLNLQFREDRLVGASSLGLTEHVGVIRGLIEGGVPLGAWKARLVQDPTRLMEAYLGTAQGMAAAA